MADVELFGDRPLLRCYFPTGIAARPVCGQGAAWVRLSRTGQVSGYFCDRHRAIDDALVPPITPIRLVSLTVEVLFAGASFAAGEAQAEALLQLERAVEAAGGELRVHQATSRLGKYATPRAPGVKRAGEGVP